MSCNVNSCSERLYRAGGLEWASCPPFCVMYGFIFTPCYAFVLCIDLSLYFTHNRVFISNRQSNQQPKARSLSKGTLPSIRWHRSAIPCGSSAPTEATLRKCAHEYVILCGRGREREREKERAREQESERARERESARNSSISSSM